MNCEFLMPAEWYPHDATWLAWPHNLETWPDNLAQAQAEFVEFAKVIAEGEQVHVLCGGEAQQSARTLLNGLKNLTLHPIKTNDAWIRDYGPTLVIDQVDQVLAGIHFNYDCWGEKYPPFDDDQRVARKVCDVLAIETYSTTLAGSQFIGEGGGVEVDGNGLALNTDCWLKRNQGLNRSDVDLVLGDYLGVHKSCWLPGSRIPGDDTNGHIDQIARFTESGSILVATDPVDAESPINQNRGHLENWFGLQTPAERPDFSLVELPLPSPRQVAGRQIPASYTNFYVCNRGVIVPQFGDPAADRLAVEAIQNCFSREVIGLPSIHLSIGLGSFHCLSQQQPAVGRTSF